MDFFHDPHSHSVAGRKEFIRNRLILIRTEINHRRNAVTIAKQINVKSIDVTLDFGKRKNRTLRKCVPSAGQATGRGAVGTTRGRNRINNDIH